MKRIKVRSRRVTLVRDPIQKDTREQRPPKHRNRVEIRYNPSYMTDGIHTEVFRNVKSKYSAQRTLGKRPHHYIKKAYWHDGNGEKHSLSVRENINVVPCAGV